MPLPSLTTSWNALVRAAPRKIALIEAATGRSWARADLAVHAAAWHRALPVGAAGRRLAFSLPNGPDWLACFIAVLRAGSAAVPLDPSEPPDAQRALAQAARAAFRWTGSAWEALGRPRARASDLAVIKLTSGSTGSPRPLAFTHAEMRADGRQVCTTMGIRADDLNLAVIPFGHSYGLGNLVVPLLDQGTPLVCAGSPLPHALASDVARWRPTVFPAVPALLRALAQSDLASNDFQSLRTVISAGAPLSPEVARAFLDRFQRRVHGFYGSTETGGISYDRSGDATLAGRSVGAALDRVRLTPIRGGRLRVSSAAVFTTGNRLRAGRLGACLPADRVTLTPDGEVVLLGRAGRLVKIAGRRLDLAELERTLRALPGVRDAYVALHPAHPDALAAVLATTASAVDLKRQLRTHLAPWKIPRRLIVRPDFPLTPRGKPDTRALQALLAG